MARLLDIAQPRLVITDDGLLPVLAEAATMTATKVTLILTLGQWRFSPAPVLQIDIVTISDKSESAATPLSQFLLNDGSKFDTRPSFDVKENLGILPFSSGTTGDESPAIATLM